MPRESCQSCLSVDNGNTEVKTGPAHRYSGICLIAEKNPGKPQVGDCLKAVRIGSFPPNEVSRIAKLDIGKRKEREEDFDRK